MMLPCAATENLKPIVRCMIVLDEEVSASSLAAVHYDPDLKDVNIVATYSDHYGNIRLVIPRDSFQNVSIMEGSASHSTTNQSGESENQFPHVKFTSPAKLKRHQCGENQRVIGKATSDADLPSSALDQAKAMGHALSLAKDELYDCHELAKKFRAMLQSTERNVDGLKKKGTFLIQLAAKTFPQPLHCLSLQLAADYFLLGLNEEDAVKKDANRIKFEDPSLYHYAIFSDNVLATSVVVNSTVLNAKEPQKHVFHIVTDKLNFAAMKMWFRINAPVDATIQVENINDFKWLNSSYCSVLRQL
ncbi:unnamed protein product [Arabis nemorensis]|uniref:Hexosyltransferase n=1 Tax=Arabis nemorensis TaxID=586526 RepID=A0A565C7E2_9BRAS|nr:unnamed protein product [Arabis nemorensis]